MEGFAILLALRGLDCQILLALRGLDLTNYNAYRVKAICKNAFFPENEADLIALYTKKQDYVLLGSGHNIICSKPYYDADFVIFNGNVITFDVANQ